MDQTAPPSTSEVIVVQESMRLIHFTWGLVLGFTIVGLAVMNLFGNSNPDNRTAITVITIVAPAIFISIWVWNVRHPRRIEFSHDAISFKVHSSKKTKTIERTDGQLEWAMEATLIGTRAAPTQVLRPVHGRPSLPVGTFDWPQIERACQATGWTLVGNVPGRRRKGGRGTAEGAEPG